MNITTGPKPGAIRAVVYGPEGIGKTTLASRWPNPLFFDVEGGTAEMDVARLDRPASWSAIMQTLASLAGNMQGYQTLVIDTADWAEKILKDHVCAANNVQALGDKPYGQLYMQVSVEWGRFLDMLTRIADGGTHIVVLAHSQIVHCDIPEESGEYDKYEMKLLSSFKVSLAGMCKEWASLVLFCSYETFITEGKATGGKRVIHANHHPCWDAKQRTGMNLPDKLDFPADRMPPELARLFATPPPPQVAAKADDCPADLNSQPQPQVAATEDPEKANLLGQLKQLMIDAKVSLPALDAELAKRGVVPAGTHPTAFNVQTLKRIVTNWDKVVHNIHVAQK